jgi:hypothetical protein
MTVTIEPLRHQLEIDFRRGREELIEARLRQGQKDTPHNRSYVAECRTRVDAVLDMHLEMMRALSADWRVRAEPRSHSPAT